MPHVYCPRSECAARTAYDTVKPTHCPRCTKAFAAAFKVAPVAPPPVARACVDDPDDRPLTRTTLAARQRQGITTKVKPRMRRGEVDPLAMANVMNAPDAVDDPLPLDPGGDDDGEPYNPREARRLARELAASIDPSTIIVQDQDEDVVRFSTFVDEAKRNGGKMPGGKAKRRR